MKTVRADMQDEYGKLGATGKIYTTKTPFKLECAYELQEVRNFVFLFQPTTTTQLSNQYLLTWFHVGTSMLHYTWRVERRKG